MKLKKKQIRRFFDFMNERHRIYLRREKGESFPWTKDPILLKWKFTNVFRQLDRVTVELGKRLEGVKSSELILFKIAAFRIFNWPTTFDLIEDLTNGEWNLRRATTILDNRKRAGGKLFTGAYIITSAGAPSKHRQALKTIGEIWKDRASLLRFIKRRNSMLETTLLFTQYPMIGNFIGYEYACDLRHTKILRDADDILYWANTGPGAKRGVNRVLGLDFKSPLKPAEANSYMHELLMLSPDYLADWMPALEMRDVEHTLCEFDKYERTRLDEGRPRSRFIPPNERTE